MSVTQGVFLGPATAPWGMAGKARQSRLSEPIRERALPVEVPWEAFHTVNTLLWKCWLILQLRPTWSKSSNWVCLLELCLHWVWV